MKKMVSNKVHLQLACEANSIPTLKQFKMWVKAALDSQSKKISNTEITLRIVDEKESAHLNQVYRHKKGPTNVLSFSYDSAPITVFDLLGDLVLCAPLIVEEANTQHKEIEAHWAHLTIHGILHLLGYNHVQEQDAEIMEALEIQILKKLGFPNPYIETVT